MAMDGTLPLGSQSLAYQVPVLLHDRRNCDGASGFLYDDITGVESAEHVRQGEDLHELICGLELSPALLVGQSAGGRLCVSLAARHPETVAGLCLVALTGGPGAAERLASGYYLRFAALADDDGSSSSKGGSGGGMQAVAQTKLFQRIIAGGDAIRDESPPEERKGGEGEADAATSISLAEQLMSTSPAVFKAAMLASSEALTLTATAPALGASIEALEKIGCPAVCISLTRPSEDKGDGMHSAKVMRDLAAALPNCLALCELPIDPPRRRRRRKAAEDQAGDAATEAGGGGGGAAGNEKRLLLRDRIPGLLVEHFFGHGTDTA